MEIAYLTKQERDEIFARLNEQQQNFLTDHLRRGKKTAFANVLAREKSGGHISDEFSAIADRWEFLDYKDAGPNWQAKKELVCECGRILRYQYVIRNNETGEVKKFGITHFEEHTGIPPELARAIVKGLEEIDYELDEILLKVENGWTLADEGININNLPDSITLPKDIQNHLDLDLPLLRRQVDRLQLIIRDYLNEQIQAKREAILREKQLEEERKMKEYKLMKETIHSNKQNIVQKEFDLREEFQQGIIVFLQLHKEEKFLASDLCEELIIYFNADRERFSTGKYKIFPDVCQYLEHLRDEGFLELIGIKPNLDRVYKILNRDVASLSLDV